MSGRSHLMVADPGWPRAVAMWEFSWLVRRTGNEAEYAQPDRVLDELVERGYDCVRIDAFPHLIASDRAGTSRDRFCVSPQPAHFMWGNHEKVTVNEPARELVDFIARCHSRGVSVGLSSWFNDDDEHRRLELATPADFCRIWSETLKVLDDSGVLDAVVWVDLCNEWPLDVWAPAAAIGIFGSEARAASAATGRAWEPDELARTQSFFGAIEPLRAQWPQLRFTYSFAPVTGSLFDLDPRGLDFIETHIWLSMNVPDFAAQTTFAVADLGFPQAWQRQVDRLEDVYWPDPSRWLDALATQMSRWASWASDHGLPLWTTEGWSHVSMDQYTSVAGRSSWDYVRHVAEFAVPLAVDLGWAGVCTSNFAQPHFPGMWADVRWHRRLTDRIRAGARQ